MANSTENDTLCNLSPTVEETIHFIVYRITLPIYLVMGLAANIILLIAFYRQSKNEQTYKYQVWLTVSKACEVFVQGTWLLLLHWFSGVFVDASSEWLQKSHPLMFITFRFGPPGHMHFITSSLLLAVAMSADRAFALSFPFRYKNINHSRVQAIAATMCFLFPATSSLCYIWVFKIFKEGDLYKSAVDVDYVSNAVPVFLSRFGVATRLAGLIALISLNCVIVVQFRKNNRTVGQMVNQEDRATLTKVANRTLLMLNTAQSVLIFFNQAPHVIVLVLLFLVPSVSRCGSLIPAASGDAPIMITDSIDLLVVVAISPKMREAVLSLFKRESDANNVVPTAASGIPSAS